MNNTGYTSRTELNINKQSNMQLHLVLSAYFQCH